jgi:flavin-dependent dehydrogenase
VVYDVTRLRRTHHGSFAQVITDTVRADTALAARFASATQVSEAVALGPLGVDVGTTGVPGLVLAGDAAGFVDPMTGDGLRFAIRGGELAADAVAEELATGAAAYITLASSRRREFRAKSRFNRGIRWLTGSPGGMAAAELIATCWDAPFAPLIRIAGDCGLARQLAAR